MAKSHNIVHHIFTKKITLYGIMGTLLLLIITQNIYAKEQPADDLGRDSILFELVADQSGIHVLIEDNAPPQQTGMPVSVVAEQVVTSETAATPTVEIPEQEYNENTTTVIMGGLALTTTNDTATPRTRTEIENYTVQGGDTVTSIAKQFGISVNSILWANNLSSYSLIRPGDTLKILPFSGTLHTIARGDTLDSIAEKYQAQKQEILQTNGISDEESLAIGGSLLIPGGIKPMPRPQPTPQPTTPAPTVARETTVVPPPQDSGSDLLWPANSHRINQYYYWRHRALDIDGDIGDPVYASEDGVVEISEWNNNGYGYYIIINHGNGIKTLYAHNSENVAAAGDEVARGDLIAYIGSTGRSTGPHIHYEVRVNGSAVNPLLYTK